MKKLLLLGLGLFLLGLGLVVFDRQVLRGSDDPQLATAQRVPIGTNAEIVVDPTIDALDGHFRFPRLDVTLAVPGSEPVTVAHARVINESPWGEVLQVRTYTENNGSSYVSNMEMICPRLNVPIPGNAALVGRFGSVVVSGRLVYPTARVGAVAFEEETRDIEQRIPIHFVATAADMVPPPRRVERVGVVTLYAGLLIFGVVFVGSFYRSLQIFPGATFPQFRDADELRQAVRQGGRFVHFRYAVSIAIMTFRRASEIYYIPPGGSAFYPGFKWTVLSLLLGWWGIPWGPIYTVEAMVENLGGGVDVTDVVVAKLTATVPPSMPGAAAAPPPLT